MRIELGGFETYWEERGSGLPLVLVHGLGGSTATWQKVAPPLASDFHVVSYDLRGLGRSETPPPPYSLSLLAADLGRLVDGLGLGRVALVGHSLGGAIALAVAARRPELVRAVVAVSAPSVTREAQSAHLAERAQLARRAGMQPIADLHVRTALPPPFVAEHPDDVAAYRRIVAASDPEGYAALCGVIAGLDLTSELERIGAPALLVHGELDQVVPLADARETAARIQGCRLVVLDGCGHVVPFERPDDLVAGVRELAAPPTPA